MFLSEGLSKHTVSASSYEVCHVIVQGIASDTHYETSEPKRADDSASF